MIDLAPHNPYGLPLQAPVIIAPSCAPANPRDLDPTLIGAYATVFATSHAPDERAVRWAAVPAGVVFERLPTVRLRSLLNAEAKRWARSDLPVLLSLRGTADELANMAELLEPLQGLAGVVLASEADQMAAAVAAVRSQTALPLLAVLPAPDAVDLAPELVAAGSDALIVSAYPRGAAVMNQVIIGGVLVGPTLAPWTIGTLNRVAQLVGVPLVALGGIADVATARQCLAAGASAVMIDAALHGAIDAPEGIGAALLDSRSA